MIFLCKQFGQVGYGCPPAHLVELNLIYLHIIMAFAVQPHLSPSRRKVSRLILVPLPDLLFGPNLVRPITDTFHLIHRDNHLVLRARPSGALISPTAHNLLREYTVLSRLNAYNSYLISHRTDLKTKSKSNSGQEEDNDNDNDVDEWLVPVPRTYGYYPGDEKRKEGDGLGVDKVGMPEFYVMEFKEGNVFEDCEFPELDREEEKAEW